jgi:DNA-binding response OmpR family regulator
MFGHDSAIATTASDALALLDRFDPDVALVDLGLPDISGFELARRIRERCGSRIFVIAWSGWTGSEHREHALQAGCDRFLVKPVQGHVLLDELHVFDERLARSE